MLFTTLLTNTSSLWVFPVYFLSLETLSEPWWSLICWKSGKKPCNQSHRSWKLCHMKLSYFRADFIFKGEYDEDSSSSGYDGGLILASILHHVSLSQVRTFVNLFHQMLTREHYALLECGPAFACKNQYRRKTYRPNWVFKQSRCWMQEAGKSFISCDRR